MGINPSNTHSLSKSKNSIVMIKAIWIQYVLDDADQQDRDTFSQRILFNNVQKEYRNWETPAFSHEKFEKFSYYNETKSSKIDFNMVLNNSAFDMHILISLRGLFNWFYIWSKSSFERISNNNRSFKNEYSSQGLDKMWMKSIKDWFLASKPDVW